MNVPAAKPLRRGRGAAACFTDPNLNVAQPVRRYLSLLAGLGVTLAAHFAVAGEVDFLRGWGLVRGADPLTYEDAQFVYAALPRLLLAFMIGGCLGLVGSVLQQATQNRLASPMTFGAASGAWLALVAASIYAPEIASRYGEWVSMSGAILATGLVVAMVGRERISGLPIILAGMAVTMLCGALASALVMMNEEYARNLFIWGAGDLTQIDWRWVNWLSPRLSIALLLLFVAPRTLTLLRLGDAAAGSRGLAVAPALLLLLLACLWITAGSITAVGLIGFIALLGPNMAVWLGARTSFDQMVTSLLIGAIMLIAADLLAVAASQWTANLVPTGASAALIGAPALIVLARRRLQAQDHAFFASPEGLAKLPLPLGAAILAAAALLLFVSLGVARTDAGWALGWPNDLVFSLRWPRVLTACAAGVGMATAGVLLQRLLRNPLASPDILGMTQGATLALVVSAIIFGGAIQGGVLLLAPLGSVAVLALLLGLGRRHDYAPGLMALTGIAIAALMDATVQFALASGSENAFAILNWLGGSTYRASGGTALALCAALLPLVGIAIILHRWQTLLSIGDDIAGARGLHTQRARIVLLVVPAAITAAVTALIGPISFVGLLAPHAASILGARTARAQVLWAAVLGAALMLASDWLGRTLLYPRQLPAGTIAAALGGAYFVLLLTLGRRAAPK